MNLLRCFFLLQFATTLALAQPALPGNSADPSDEPAEMVHNLYREVVARHPVGVPEGAVLRIFAPYMSKQLLHSIDLFQGCNADWLRQYPDPQLKAPFGVSESGIFSGVYERTDPTLARIKTTQMEGDGSYRVDVTLTYEDPPGDRHPWGVAAIVVRENDHYVLNDVIYLKDADLPVESRLSDALSDHCDGPYWKGYGTQ
jgi:hypothetical protein